MNPKTGQRLKADLDTLSVSDTIMDGNILATGELKSC